jgi:hypothetical protein
MRREHDHTRNCLFRQCPTCGTRWDSRGAFLGDPQNQWNGYQADLTKGKRATESAGYAVFTHMTHECGTSMAIPVCDLGVLLGCPNLGPAGQCSCATSELQTASVESPNCKLTGDARGVQGNAAGPAQAA